MLKPLTVFAFVFVALIILGSQAFVVLRALHNIDSQITKQYQQR